MTGAEGQNGLFASAVYDKDKNELIVKVANTSNTAQPISLNFAGLKKQDVLSNGRCIKLRSLDLDKDNTLEQPLPLLRKRLRYPLKDMCLQPNWNRIHLLFINSRRNDK